MRRAARRHAHAEFRRAGVGVAHYVRFIRKISQRRAGKFLKDEWGNIGEPTIESVYTYDNQGRLLKVTNSAKPDNPVTFQYDHRGRKTKLQASRPEDYRPNSAHAGSPFEVADSPPNLDGGGSATTFYDGQDRPTEVHGFLLAITSPGTTISQGLTLICGR
jgi:YD repeat-containing protein